MTHMTLADAYSIVDNNFDQTELVSNLLSEWFIDFWLIEYHIVNLTEEEEETEDWESTIDIYGWWVFPELIDSDYQKLIEAWIPVLRTDYGNWVAVTSYGSHYDMDFYPQLIKVLFDIDTDNKEIYHMKRGR